MLFLGYQFLKTFILRSIGDYNPKPLAWLVFLAAESELLPQSRMPLARSQPCTYSPKTLEKELYTGTNVVLFTFVNASKVPFYIYLGMLDKHLFLKSLMLLPIIPVGTYLGIWMNKAVNEEIFNGVIYVTLFLNECEN